MARVSIDGDDLVVEIEGMDKLWSLKSRLVIPLANVRGATADPGIAAEPKGLRAPGTSLPGVITAGTFHQDGERVFLYVAAGALLVGSVGVGALPATAGQAVPSTDREISFTVDGTTTYGTLHVPAPHRGRKMPAALLLPGSGPPDRDGNQPPALTPRTLSKLAEALARDGVVSLRFDKYGTGRTGLGAYAAKPETIDYPAFIRQADAAYRLLAGRPEVNQQAVRLIGHSEGALTALQVAVAAQPRTAGVGLLQPLAQRFLDVLSRQLHDQLAAAVAAGQMSREQQRTVGRAIDQAIADFRAHRPIDTSDMPLPLAELFRGLGGPNQRFVETIDAVDPAAVALRLPGRTAALLTCGTVDSGPGKVTLPGVEHLLAEPADPETLAPAALDALHQFMQCRT
jgi:uncharacterized protein